MNEYYKKFEKFDKGNCSTVVIGKDASVTGKVILGHNEDDSDSIVELHLVPRMKHREGETISFKDADAVIPQVPGNIFLLLVGSSLQRRNIFCRRFCKRKRCGGCK